MTLTFGMYGETLSTKLKEKLQLKYKTKESTLNITTTNNLKRCDFCNVYHDSTSSCKIKVYSIYKYLSLYFKKTKFYSKKNKKNKYNFYTNRSVYDNPFNKLHWRQK